MIKQIRLFRTFLNMPVLLSLVVIVLGSRTPLRGQNVKVIVSSQAGDRLSAKPSLHFGGKAGVTGPTFAINEDATYQKIDGFGAMGFHSANGFTSQTRAGRRAASRSNAPASSGGRTPACRPHRIVSR